MMNFLYFTPHMSNEKIMERNADARDDYTILMIARSIMTLPYNLSLSSKESNFVYILFL